MASAPADIPNPSRPRSVTLIAVGVLLLGLVNIYRALILYQQTDLQLGLGVSLDPRVRMVIAVIWSIVLIALAAALWIRKPLTRLLVPLLLLVYAIYRLALIGIFAKSVYVRESQIVTVVLYGLAIAFTSWALNRKAVRGYFEKGKVDQDIHSGPSHIAR